MTRLSKRSDSLWTVRVNEGDWYAVPLKNGGYGVGLVARKGRRGALLGYFFGPRYEQVPTLDAVRGLHPDAALLRAIFGDLGIQLGKWPLLGRLDTWHREQWPLPEFGRIEDEARGVAWIANYESVDISENPRERRCSIEEARRLPEDGDWGYGAIQNVLTQKLSS